MLALETTLKRRFFGEKTMLLVGDSEHAEMIVVDNPTDLEWPVQCPHDQSQGMSSIPRLANSAIEVSFF